MNGYFLLSLAIVSEIVATSSLKLSDGLTRFVPSLVVVAGYVAAFLLLSQVVKTIPIGVAYALWAGVGIVGTSLVALWLYGQKLDFPAVVGMALIVGGVIVIHLFSRATA